MGTVCHLFQSRYKSSVVEYWHREELVYFIFSALLILAIFHTLFLIVDYLSFCFAALLCKISALRSFSLDKLHYRRESESGMSSLAYFLSKDTVDLFNIIIKPLVFLSMFYSFNNPRSTFPENYVVLLCLVYCVTGIAYVFAIFLQPAQAQLVNPESIYD